MPTRTKITRTKITRKRMRKGGVTERTANTHGRTTGVYTSTGFYSRLEKPLAIYYKYPWSSYGINLSINGKKQYLDFLDRVEDNFINLYSIGTVEVDPTEGPILNRFIEHIDYARNRAKHLSRKDTINKLHTDFSRDINVLYDLYREDLQKRVARANQFKVDQQIRIDNSVARTKHDLDAALAAASAGPKQAPPTLTPHQEYVRRRQDIREAAIRRHERAQELYSRHQQNQHPRNPQVREP